MIVQFHLLDILSGAGSDQLPRFDVIISNPPYIPQNDKMNMAANVLQYEPHLALFVEDADPLLFYKAIADFAILHLNKDGHIYLEIHEAMASDVMQLYTQKGFSQTELRKDLQGKDRMLKLKR